MDQTHQRVLSDMESFMSKYTNKNSYSLEEKEQIIIYLVKLYDQLKSSQSPPIFKNQQEEIYYFKNVKPLLISQLILFVKLYKMESEKPNLCIKATYKYYKRELLKLNYYFEDNCEFYTYFKTKSTHSDKLFFLRNRHNIRLRLEPYLIDFNFEHSTSHCYKLAEIIACDQLATYIKQQLTKYPTSPQKADPYEPSIIKLEWTADKRDLVELIYALHERKAVNHGHIEIQELVNRFSYFFGIELINYYNEFYKTTKRKSSTTRFIDELKNGLLQRGS